MKKYFSKLILGAVVGVSLLPTSGHALIVTHPAMYPVDIMTIASKAVVIAQLTAIGATEVLNAKSLLSAKKETVGTIQEVHKSEATSIAATLKQNIITRSVNKTARDFTPMSQTKSSCDDLEDCQEKVNGQITKKALQEAIGIFVQSYNNGTLTKQEQTRRRRSIGQNTDYADSRGMFPEAGTIIDQEKAIAQVVLLTNPVPIVKLGEDFRTEGTFFKQEHSKLYEATRMRQQGQLAVPQKALIDITSAYLPSHKLSARQQEVYAERGLGIETVNNVGGEISENAVFDMKVAERYASASWTQRIHSESATGVLRELIQIESVDLPMQLKLMKLDEYRMALLAQSSSREIGQSIDANKTYLRKTGKKIETNLDN